MKFRIIKYYERYKAQAAVEEGKYTDIGSPTGYHSVEEAKLYCKVFKNNIDNKIVEEFEL